MSIYHPLNEHPYPVLGDYPMTRNERILSQLHKGEESASNLALILDCPISSIRRSIQELRAYGHNISFSGLGSSELYRLGV